jgi:hypothetical protein
VAVGKGIGVGLIAALVWATIAVASPVGFKGATKTNGASVTFEVAKQNGGYRTIKEFNAGDIDKGIEVNCDMSGPGESSFEYTDPINVKPDGTFKSGSPAFDIRGKFVSKSKSKGTIEITTDILGNQCASGPVKFIAGRV